MKKKNQQISRETSRQTIAENKSKLLKTRKYLKGLIVKDNSIGKTFERFITVIASMIDLLGDVLVYTLSVKLTLSDLPNHTQTQHEYCAFVGNYLDDLIILVITVTSKSFEAVSYDLLLEKLKRDLDNCQVLPTLLSALEYQVEQGKLQRIKSPVLELTIHR
uniref:Uncharacterized protein n=1 Tax=Glossina austeni TaxID=7395 RepID=A0A1A9UX20_GLOAU